MDLTKILIVDDEKINRLILKRSLSDNKSIEVYEAENGQQALEIIENNDISLILLDIIMPVMDGFEFLEYLKSTKLIDNIPVIVISAIDDYESIYKALLLGCWDYFTKPLYEEVVNKILPIKIKNILFYKKIINELKNINEELEKKIKVSTEQLIHSDRLISMGILTGQIVHEINTPLTYLKGNNGLFKTMLDLLFSEFETKYPDLKNFKIKNIEYTEFKNRIYKLLESSEIGLEKINNIIDTFRNFAKKDEDSYERVDINYIIENSLEISKNFTQNKIKIIKNLKKVPYFYCNPQKFEQVITNLIINAAQAIDEKGYIYIDTDYDDKFIIIKIKDTGKGIKKENLDKIFKLFYTTKKTGTGFGLFIIKEIIKELEGQIIVESEPDKGATFIIKIPYKKN